MNIKITMDNHWPAAATRSLDMNIFTALYLIVTCLPDSPHMFPAAAASLPLSSSSSRSRCCITHKVSRLCHRVFKRLVWCILSAIITTSRRINYIAVALIHKFTRCLGLCGSACNVPDGVWWCAKTAFTFRPIRTPPHVCVKGVDRSIDIYIYIPDCWAVIDRFWSRKEHFGAAGFRM